MTSTKLILRVVTLEQATQHATYKTKDDMQHHTVQELIYDEIFVTANVFLGCQRFVAKSVQGLGHSSHKMDKRHSRQARWIQT